MNPSSSTKALFAGVAGTALQWYDFALFGYFAPIIAATYFPKDNSIASLLSVFGLFAVGYLLAPLGALFFGYIGDHFGRKRALTLSILAMAIPTALIGIVPSYQVIGVAAPVLITLLRVIQGFVASAEFTGSAIFLVEHAKPEKKALYGCLTSSAYSLGLILAGLAASLFTALFMPTWGWRIGFGLALIAGILIFYFYAGQPLAMFALLEKDIPRTRELMYVYVDKEYRGSGFGKQIIETAKQLAIEAGADTILLDTLKPSLLNPLYEKYGAAIIGAK